MCCRTNPGQNKKEPSLSNTPKIDTLLSAADQGEEKAQVPTPEIQDKVHFIFNNLSASNLTLKTEDFRKLVQTDHYSWAARYLVLQVSSPHGYMGTWVQGYRGTEVQGYMSTRVQVYRGTCLILACRERLQN